MENLIDKRYFWGEIELTGMYKDETETALNLYITKHQKNYIKKMFNTAFDDAMPADIKAMLFDEATLTSPIANYVYYYWQKSHASVQTNAGTKALNTPNTVIVNPSNKMTAAWNEMVDKNIEIQNFMYNAETVDYDYLNDIYPYLNEDIVTPINSFNI